VSSLKVDKSFVAAMDAGDADSETIIRSTLDLAHNLGLAVVAEGVETQAAFDKLAELGCDHAQGFLITRPLPQDELVSWLDSRQLRSGLKSDSGQVENARDPFRTSLAV
jgi:EAL domain-containing protein (putative c-di-GMP-specific phosphodiesterase class I)